MGTPGDKRSDELSGGSGGEQRVENELTEESAPPRENLFDSSASSVSSTSSTSEMTVIKQLPHFSTLKGYYPPEAKSSATTTKLEQTYIDEFYTGQKYAENYVLVASAPSETFPTLEEVSEPGPSGLQTPKSSKVSKVCIKRMKKSNTQPIKKSFTCQICQKTFQNSNKLTKHQQVHSSGSPFKCEHCKKSFSSKFKLVRHVLIHSDRKPFSCSVCERTFHRKDHLKNHIKVHNPCKKLYICERPDCKKEYTSLLSYKKHSALHAAEEGNLDCQICKKLFKTKDEILYHLKIHAGSRTVKNPEEKKYSCDHCQRKFFTRKDVRRHMVVHTGKRDFLCQYCPQRFGRKDHLVRHIKKSHTRHIQSEKTTAVKEEKPSSSETGDPIKSETEESNPATEEHESTTTFDLDSLLMLPHTSTQGDIPDLGSEVLDEITQSSTAEIFPDSSFISLLDENESLPLPAFDQIFQQPPQQQQQQLQQQHHTHQSPDLQPPQK